MRIILAAVAALLFASLPAAAQEADDPELIFKKTTVWRNCQQAQLMYYHPSQAALGQLSPPHFQRLRPATAESP